MKRLLVVVGSKNDIVYLAEVQKLFKQHNIKFEINIISVHRNIALLVKELEPNKLDKENIKVILAVAHSVSNLPAIIAGFLKGTKISVIGVGLA
ncbi:MAG TPA: AIR carboxylase family protein, partial [Candidatus Paceibacterota bacterium]